MVKKYYQILGVSKTATRVEILKAYRDLAKIYHPDKFFSNKVNCGNTKPGEKTRILCGQQITGSNDLWFCEVGNHKDIYDEGKEKFQKIKDAYETLSDPQKRATYDRFGDNDKPYTPPPNNPPPPPPPYNPPPSRKTKTERIKEKAITELIKLKGWWKLSKSERESLINEVHFLIGTASLIDGLNEIKSKAKRLIESKGEVPEEPEPDINQQRQDFINQLTALEGWGKLSEQEQKNFINEVKRSQPDQFATILIKVQDAINNDGDEGDNNQNLPFEIQKAISEIETELNREPKIAFENEEWRTYFTDSSSLAQLASRKAEYLTFIQEYRKQKKEGGGGDQGDQNQNLSELRTYTIFQIKQALNQDPPISTNELTNSNWETQINQASNENALNAIKDQVLVNIKSIRATKRQQNLLNELLTQVRQPKNWDNYQNLENILKQVKELRTSNAYQENELEIQALESRLLELDPSQYQKTAKDLLDQQVKDNRLTDSNMDNETKKALAEAKQDPTLENIAKAEEKIAQNGEDNKLKNFVTQTWNKLKEGNLTKEEKTRLVGDILVMIATKNKYQKQACQKYKSELNKLMAELQGGTIKQEDTGTPWLKMLGIAALIALPLIVLTIIILRARRRRLGVKIKISRK